MKIKWIALLVLPISIVTASSAHAADSVPTNPVTVNLSLYAEDLAKAPNGDIWAEDYEADQIKLFSKDESNPTALKTISIRAVGGSASSADAVSIVVGSNGYLYVLDNIANKVYVFNPASGDTQSLSDAVLTINVDSNSFAMSLDSSDQIYVATRPRGNMNVFMNWTYSYVVTIYSADLTNGSSSLVRSFSTAYQEGTSYGECPTSIAVLPNGGVVILDVDENAIHIFDASATGADVSPIRTISDSAPDVYDPEEDEYFRPYPITNNSSFVLDSSERIYLLVANSIRVFDSASSGVTEPLESIDLDSLWGENDSKQAYGLTLGDNQQIWVGDYNYSKMHHFDNPYSAEDVVDPAPAPAPAQSSSEILDPAVLAARREQAIAVAKNDVRNTLASGNPLTVEQLMKADLKGVTTKNIELINKDISKLSELEKSDIRLIEKVVLKFATVDKVAEGKTFLPVDLIAVSLIPNDSKIKSSIATALRKLPASSVDTFEKIQAEVALIQKSHEERKNRLAAILAKRR
jgi:hypothetical protein